MQRGQDAHSRRARGDTGKDQPVPGGSRTLGHPAWDLQLPENFACAQQQPKSREELAGRKQRPSAMSKPCGAPAGRGQEMSPTLRGAGRERGSAVPIPSTRHRGGHKATRVDAAAPAAKRAPSWVLQHLLSWGRGARLREAPSPCRGHRAAERARQQQEVASVSHRRRWSRSPDSVCGIHNEMDTAYCSNLL